MTYTRSQRYQIVKHTMRTLAYRNRRDEPEIPGDTRMLAEELTRFEVWCDDLDERLEHADRGELRPLAEAIIAFRITVLPAPSELRR